MGKSNKQEKTDLARKLEQLESKNLNEDEKLKLLKDLLGPEGEQMIEELMLQGKSVEEIMELLKKHGTDMDSLIDDECFTEQISFDDNNNKIDKEAMNQLMDGLDTKSRAKLEKMLKEGMSPEKAMAYFEKQKQQGNLCAKLDKLLM